MYVPSHFAEHRVEVLHATIRQAGLGTLVTTGSSGLAATHIPMLLDEEPRPLGRLVGHLSRANPQWKTTAGDGAAVAIILGPDAT